jgi:hypothetical protein
MSWKTIGWGFLGALCVAAAATAAAFAFPAIAGLSIAGALGYAIAATAGIGIAGLATAGVCARKTYKTIESGRDDVFTPGSLDDVGSGAVVAAARPERQDIRRQKHIILPSCAAKVAPTKSASPGALTQREIATAAAIDKRMMEIEAEKQRVAKGKSVVASTTVIPVKRQVSAPQTPASSKMFPAARSAIAATKTESIISRILRMGGRDTLS